jgi:hypothetical protein
VILPPPKRTRIVVDDTEEEEMDQQSDQDEWLPPPKGNHERESEAEERHRSRSKRPPGENHVYNDAPDDSTHEKAKPRLPAKSTKAVPTNLVQHNLFLSQDDALDEPAVVPNRKARAEALGDDADKGGRAYVPDVGEAGAVKKKKRYSEDSY